jgi:hypothetical protein
VTAVTFIGHGFRDREGREELSLLLCEPAKATWRRRKSPPKSPAQRHAEPALWLRWKMPYERSQAEGATLPLAGRAEGGERWPNTKMGSRERSRAHGPPLQTRPWCSLRQSPLMTRLPRSPSSTLVLRLNQEIVHDFILLFMPPCGPHLTSLATGSLEPSLLVFSTPGGLTGDDLSCLFFTCTNTSQAATCTCNT